MFFNLDTFWKNQDNVGQEIMSQYMNDMTGGSIEYPMSFSLGSSGEQYDLIPPAAVGGPAGEMAPPVEAIGVPGLGKPIYPSMAYNYQPLTYGGLPDEQLWKDWTTEQFKDLGHLGLWGGGMLSGPIGGAFDLANAALYAMRDPNPYTHPLSKQLLGSDRENYYDMALAATASAFIPTIMPKSLSLGWLPGAGNKIDDLSGLWLYNKFLAPKVGDDVIRDVFRGASSHIDEWGRTLSGGIGKPLIDLFSSKSQKELSSEAMEILTETLPSNIFTKWWKGGDEVGPELLIGGKKYTAYTAREAGPEIFEEYSKETIRKQLLSDKAYNRFVNQFNEGMDLQFKDLKRYAKQYPEGFLKQFNEYISKIQDRQWIGPQGWGGGQNFTMTGTLGKGDSKIFYKGEDFSGWLQNNVTSSSGKYHYDNVIEFGITGSKINSKTVDEMIDIMNDVVGNTIDREAYETVINNTLNNRLSVKYFDPHDEIFGDAVASYRSNYGQILNRRKGFHKQRVIDIDGNIIDWHGPRPMHRDSPTQLAGDIKYSADLKKVHTEVPGTKGVYRTHDVGITTMVHEMKHLVQDNVINTLTPGFHIFNKKFKLHGNNYPEVLLRGLNENLKWKWSSLSANKKKFTDPQQFKEQTIEDYFSIIRGENYGISPQGIATRNLINNNPKLRKFYNKLGQFDTPDPYWIGAHPTRSVEIGAFMEEFRMKAGMRRMFEKWTPFGPLPGGGLPRKSLWDKMEQTVWGTSPLLLNEDTNPFSVTPR